MREKWLLVPICVELLGRPPARESAWNFNSILASCVHFALESHTFVSTGFTLLCRFNWIKVQNQITVSLLFVPRTQQPNRIKKAANSGNAAKSEPISPRNKAASCQLEANFVFAILQLIPAPFHFFIHTITAGKLLWIATAAYYRQPRSDQNAIAFSERFELV